MHPISRHLCYASINRLEGRKQQCYNRAGLQYHPWGQRGSVLGDGTQIPGYAIPDTDLPVSGVKPLLLPCRLTTWGRAADGTALSKVWQLSLCIVIISASV